LKKVSSILLSVFLTASLLVSGCGKSADDKNAKTSAGEENSIVTEPGTFPITKDKTTLKVMAQQNTYVQDYSTNEFTKLYEDKTNVHIDWNVVAGSGDQVTQKISIILASGSDYPDIIMCSQLTKPQAAIYGTQGVLIPLNDLINKYSLHLKKAFEEDDYFRKSATYLDSKIYFFPALKYTYHTSMPNKMWVYQPWLDKLGLKAPKTTDEFYDMLKAFKEKDPNGNGKADELPMIAMGVKNYNGMVRFLMSAFTMPEGYYLDKDKVIYTPANQEYKEGIKYIKKLYDEGLITKDSVVMDRKQATSLVENPGAPIIGAEPGLWYGMFTTIGAPSGRYKEFSAIAPLKGPKGVQLTSHLNDSVGVAAVVTKSCQYPEVAVRWIDWLYSTEGDLTSSWGPEGTGWRKANAGEKGIDGNPALYAILGSQQFGQNQNKTWANPIAAYESVKFRMGVATSDPNDTEPRLYKETKEKYEPYATKDNQELPWLWMSEQESQEYAQLDVLINKAWEEGLAKVISSGKDVDKEWDAVISNLNNMGLKRAIELRQNAYDAYLKSTKK